MPDISLQTDVSVTALKTIPGLRNLISIASEDNVQCQAILALESLGTRVPVSQALIDRAASTLASNNNVKWMHLRLFIGLSQGGTATLLRSSTSGVKVFVLISALKLSHHDTEISDVLHHIMVKSGIQRDVPVPSAQLSPVIELLGGYARQLAPSIEDTFLQVSNQVIHHYNVGTKIPSRLTERLSPHLTGDIVAQVFEGLTNAEVHQITLEGMVSGVWLATLWYWMIPEWVFVTLNGSVIIGSTTAKFHIQLQDSKEADNQWCYREWRKEERLFDSIITFSKYDIVSKLDTKFIHWRSARLILQMLYGWTSEATIVIGQLSNAILKLIIEQGVIHRGLPWSEAKLKDIASAYFIARYESYMTQFGWTVEELEPSKALFARIRKAIPEPPFFIQTEIEEMFTTVVQREHPMLDLGDSTLSDLVAFAVLIATTAMVVSCFQPDDDTNHDSSIGKYCLTIDMARYRESSTILKKLLLEEGLGVAEFRSTIFATMLSIPLKDMIADELIQHKDGIVVYPTILFSPSCGKTMALAYSIKYGTIKHEKYKYKVVRDVKPLEFRPDKNTTINTERLKAYERGKYLCLRPRTQWSRQFTNFEMISHAKGDSIFVKTTFRFSLIESQSQAVLSKTPILTTPAEGSIEEKEFSWINAMNGLACAIHLSPNILGQPSPRAEEDIARRLHENETLVWAVWLSPSSTLRAPNPLPYPYSKEESRQVRQLLVACTEGDAMLQLFQLSNLGDHAVFLSNRLNIVKSIAVAEELVKKMELQLRISGRADTRIDWIIIT